MNIPFVDLHKQYQSIQGEIDEAIRKVIESSAFIRGPFVQKFQEAFAADYGVKHCIPVANGTDAIYIALKMLGIGDGDEVITTAHSWISTSETIVQTGAKPVFVDVDEYYILDVSKIEENITKATRAIIPVHLYGQPADMDRVMAIAKKHGLYVVEDCAQAHYATWKGQRVGTFGDAGTFSFYPGKNLGAYGDAGAVVTNNDELAEKIRVYANHGAKKKHFHHINGINSRMDGIQAAILSAKLPYIHEWTRKRQEVAAFYHQLLEKHLDIQAPKVRSGATHVYHLYVIQTNHRDQAKKKLSERGIQSSVHYPFPLPMMEAYRYLNYSEEDFPVAVSNSGRILSLPVYPEMTKQMVEFVVRNLEEVTGL